jgi:diguanylate cyclase (GGDEF)-like protein/PAS domain S-box-containing protein
MLGYQLSELRPISSDIWIKLAHPEDSKIVMQLKEHPFTKENPFYDSEFRMLHKNGQWIWVHVIGKVTMWSDGNLPSLMFGTQQEITLRKNLEKKVYYQANFDSLTGLASRTLAEERLKLTLEIAVRSKHTVGVLFMDLNGLKDINDTLGHDAGDFLIQEAARRIKSCTRATDTVSRFGGDEYLVILSDIKSKKNAEMVAHNIIKAMEEVIMIQDHFFKVGVSIGISLFPDCTLDRKKLIHFADQAMYLIKKTGKSGYLVAS